AWRRAAACAPGGSGGFGLMTPLSIGRPPRAGRTCSTSVTYAGARPSVVRRCVPVTFFTVAGIRGVVRRSVRTKTTPESGGAGRNRRRTFAPVRNPTPQTSAGRASVRWGRYESFFTVRALGRRMGARAGLGVPGAGGSCPRRGPDDTAGPRAGVKSSLAAGPRGRRGRRRRGGRITPVERGYHRARQVDVRLVVERDRRLGRHLPHDVVLRVQVTAVGGGRVRERKDEVEAVGIRDGLDDALDLLEDLHGDIALFFADLLSGLAVEVLQFALQSENVLLVLFLLLRRDRRLGQFGLQPLDFVPFLVHL